MAFHRYEFANAFLWRLVINQIAEGKERRTQLATVGEGLPAFFALVRLVSPMAALMAIQSCLPGKGLPTD